MYAKASQHTQNTYTYTKAAQLAQNHKPYTYEKSTQCAQKKSRIRTKKTHNVSKSRTQTYEKDANVR